MTEKGPTDQELAEKKAKIDKLFAEYKDLVKTNSLNDMFCLL